MNGNELSDLIDQRWSTLDELLEISRRQRAVIDTGNMSDLMRLLSDKQKPLARLSEITEKIRIAADDDPTARKWASESARVQCRQRQQECETALHASRESIQQKIGRVDAGREAANSYSHSQSASTCGGKLDLSE